MRALSQLRGKSRWLAEIHIGLILTDVDIYFVIALMLGARPVGRIS